MSIQFNPDKDIPDLTNRVIIITGGTDGLGKESVLQLSKHNPSHIYLAARSSTKASSTISEIQSKNSSGCCPITHLPLDLSSFDSIKSAAKTFLSTNTRLDILMANAGIMGSKTLTSEGYETSFGVNHMGHALFIQLLLPLMLDTAATQPNADVRLVMLGSKAESLAPRAYQFDTIKDETKSASTGIWTLYGHSKLANTHYAMVLAQKYPETTSHVKFVSVHPGAVTTNLGSDLLKNWPRLEKGLRGMLSYIMTPVEKGVLNQLWAATTPNKVDVVSGEFYFPVGQTGKGTDRVKDQKMADSLWEFTQKEFVGHVGLP